MTTRKTKNAQILVVTLLVLVVVGVVVIGMIILLGRDTDQVALNQKYQQTYSVAETSLNSFLQDATSQEIELADFQSLTELQDGTDVSGSCGPPAAIDGRTTEVECNFTVNTEDAEADFPVDLELTISDKKDIDDFPMSKDEALTLNLNGYKNGFNMNWNGSVAMQFQITYYVDANSNGIWDSSEELLSINDVYDNQTGTYDSLTGDDPVNDPNNIHDMNFFSGDTNSAGFSIGNTRVPNPSGTGTLQINNSMFETHTLTVIPRSKTETSTNEIVVSITPNNPANLADFQVREFLAVGVDSSDSNAPVAEVLSLVPIFPRIDSIFNYSLLTKDFLE